MFRTAVCVMVSVVLCAGLAHSFSWDIVRGFRHRLEFIDINGTISHTENVTSDIIHRLTYDPVHNRVLFTDWHDIYSFDITTKKTEYLMRTTNVTVTGFAYDPATELLFWVVLWYSHGLHTDIYSISLKPNSDRNKVNEKHLILSEQDYIILIAVVSCGGFLYWISGSKINRVRFSGSEKEVVIDNDNIINSFTIDQQAQKIYFIDWAPSIKSADLNGKNLRTKFVLTQPGFFLTVSKDFMYLDFYDHHVTVTTMQIPKNPPRGIDVEPKQFFKIGTLYWNIHDTSHLTAYWNINEIIPQEIQNCDNLKSLLPNNSVSADVSLLCVYGTKVDGESRCECAQGYSGERCDGSVCHNYCLYGDCSTSADGQPKCRCYAGYLGDRCEVNSCQGYCLNDGLCSLSEEGKPLCRCTGHYESERCDVPLFQTKCFQVILLLKDILNTDVTSFKGVTSTCASTDA